MKLVAITDDLFEKLFTINFSHKAFDSLNESMLSEHLTITPDKETRKLLTDYRISHRFEDDIFLCYIQCRFLAPPAKTPKGAYIVPAPNTLFRFLLRANSYFMDATMIEPVAKGKAYYFTNRSNVGTSMSISQDADGINTNDIAIVTGIDVKEACLGVIDIFSSGAVNNNYELFTGTEGQLLIPRYRLNFKSSI